MKTDSKRKYDVKPPPAPDRISLPLLNKTGLPARPAAPPPPSSPGATVLTFRVSSETPKIPFDGSRDRAAGTGSS